MISCITFGFDTETQHGKSKVQPLSRVTSHDTSAIIPDDCGAAWEKGCSVEHLSAEKYHDDDIKENVKVIGKMSCSKTPQTREFVIHSRPPKISDRPETDDSSVFVILLTHDTQYVQHQYQENIQNTPNLDLFPDYYTFSFNVLCLFDWHWPKNIIYIKAALVVVLLGVFFWLLGCALLQL